MWAKARDEQPVVRWFQDLQHERRMPASLKYTHSRASNHSAIALFQAPYAGQVVRPLGLACQDADTAVQARKFDTVPILSESIGFGRGRTVRERSMQAIQQRAARCILATAVTVMATLAACAQSADGAFALPPGNAEDGRTAFVTLGCATCHDVIGAKGLASGDQTPQMTIPLGGVRDRVFTYNELVTSIINPSHTLADVQGVAVTDQEGGSRMPSFNDAMTVQNLIDIVTFLEDHYQLDPYQ